MATTYGLSYVIPGADFSNNPNLPYDFPDEAMSPGTILLIDPTIPSGAIQGVLLNNAVIPNIAVDLAATRLGVAISDSLRPVIKTNASIPGSNKMLVERSAKQGIHGMPSQVNDAANNYYRIEIPTALRDYMIANSDTRKFYMSMWYYVTRAAKTATTAYLGLNVNTNDYLTIMRPTGVIPNNQEGAKAEPASDTVNHKAFRSVGLNKWTGSKANVGVAYYALKWGSNGPWSSFEVNNAASFVFYRMTIEELKSDLYPGGRTYAEAEAADYAAYTAAFAAGGRLAGDTFADPAVAMP